jgi:hypothetical protein
MFSLICLFLIQSNLSKPNPFETEEFVQYRQVFGLWHRFKLHRYLVDGTVKSCLDYRQVFGLLRVWFRQVFGLLRFWFRQVFGLLRVWFRQVFGLLRVWFRQVSLYNTASQTNIKLNIVMFYSYRYIVDVPSLKRTHFGGYVNEKQTFEDFVRLQTCFNFRLYKYTLHCRVFCLFVFLRLGWNIFHLNLDLYMIIMFIILIVEICQDVHFQTIMFFIWLTSKLLFTKTSHQCCNLDKPSCNWSPPPAQQTLSCQLCLTIVTNLLWKIVDNIFVLFLMILILSSFNDFDTWKK